MLEVTAPVVFINVPPTEVVVTFTLNVQDAFTAIVPPVKLTVVDPATAVIVPAPHEPLNPFGVATISPDGKLSVNATPASAAVLPAGLTMVKLRVVLPCIGISESPKDLLMDGGKSTATLAEAVPPVPPSVDVIAPVTLFCAPVAELMTFTLNVHEELAASVPPDNATVAPVAEIVPEPQLPVSPLGVATANPDGSGSVNATPLNEAAAFGFVTVKLNVVVLPNAIEEAPKLFVSVGGATTFKVAVLLAVPVPPSFEVMAPVVFD